MIGPLTPPEPQHTRAIACHDAAFRMVRLRRPLRLCKISGLYSIATLLPCCLRLALPVTRQHPRLANGATLCRAGVPPAKLSALFWAHLTFYSPLRHAADKVSLKENKHYHDGKTGEQGSGHQVVPHDFIITRHLSDRHR